MVWPGGGLQHSDGAGNLVFASHLNTKAMQERGNKVIDGCIVTEQSPTPDLTVEVASGNVIANGIVVAVSASDPFVGTPNSFATTQGNLTSGQAEFVAVHVDSSGVITNSEGGAATAGQQTPPEVPEDEVLLAMITLTEGDSTIDTTTDIEDWRQFVPDGIFAKEIVIGSGVVGSTQNVQLELIGNMYNAGWTPTDQDVNAVIKIISATNPYISFQVDNAIGDGNSGTLVEIMRIYDNVVQFIQDGSISIGAGNDFEIGYTGSVAYINPKVVGTSFLEIRGGVKMTGSGTSGETLALPYLTQVPGILANGMIWMESDGLHIYYAGAEKLVVGV